MVIVKLLLHTVGVVAQNYGATPPNVRPPTEQLHEQRGAEHALPCFLVFNKVVIWTRALLEGALLFALSKHCPPALARPLLHALLPASLATDPATLASIAALTPAFLAGTVLSLAGAVLRAHCYRALGSRFTFELAILPEHALVTHGVYGVVRHPSYTGLLAVAVGWLLCTLDPQGPFAAVLVSVGTFLSWPGPGYGSGSGGESGAAVVTAALVCVWAAGLTFLAVGVNKRMDKEDAMLEKNFGEEWRAWARRVPCRLVPGVY